MNQERIDECDCHSERGVLATPSVILGTGSAIPEFNFGIAASLAEYCSLLAMTNEADYFIRVISM